MIAWTDGIIPDCPLKPLHKFYDERGWLAELFRHDDLDPTLHPTMAYLSLTHPGIARGPHEHVNQTDLFVFFDGTYRLYLWDHRDDSPTNGVRQIVEAGRENPMVVMVPPRVVHAYRNIGTTDALILNCPNRLYAGWGKNEPVDEIRHEDRPDSPFQMDDA